MKKLLITTISVVFTTLIYAQNFKYLHNTIDNAIFDDIIELDSTYLLIKNQEQQKKPTFIWLDKNGNFFRDSLDSSGEGWQIKNIIKYSSKKLIIVEHEVEPNKRKIRVKICNQNFKVLNFFNFELGVNSGKHLLLNTSRLLQDSILAVTGSVVQSPGNELDAIIYFLNLNSGKDTLINVGTPNPTFDFSSDITYLGGKYYVAISRVNFSPEPDCNPYAAVLRLSANFSIDTIVPICNSVAAVYGKDLYFTVNVESVDSSTFFLSGRTDVGNDLRDNPQDMSLVKWDTNFNELNAQSFGKKDSFALETFEDIARYNADSFVFVGGTENYTVNPTGFDTTTSYFMLTKADIDGNVLWTRYYTNNTYLQMYKVLATSDGGALMVGTSYNHRTANGLENDVWVVKVDKNGNMDTTTSIVENGKIPEEHFVFFPNPASDYITFRQVNVQRNYQLQLYDLQGREIYQTEVNQSQIQIDVSNFAKGAYFYRLSDSNGNLASGKLIKE